jgi:ribose transport system ATP-binding protein
MISISKQFPGVQALQDVSFSLRPGEIHALVGENGAGKSTLMKILFGAIAKDSGTIRVDGREVAIHSPADAQRHGISMVHQELNLVPSMNAAQNIFLGHAPSGGPLGQVLRRREMEAGAAALLDQLGTALDIRAPIRHLSIAQRQMIEIAKSLAQRIAILVMDEPTSSLTDKEIRDLFRVMGNLTQRGVSVVYISHRLEEIFEIADRITVLRDGRVVGTVNRAEVTQDDVIRMLVGRDVQEMFPKRFVQQGEERLRVEGMTIPGAIENVTFAAHRGEILGIAGLVGAGRSEVARVLFGLETAAHGAIYVDGQRRAIRSPEAAIKQGIGFLTADRKGQGLVLGLPVEKNVVMANMDRVIRGGVIDYAERTKVANGYVRELQIRTPDVSRPVRALSGGNQQKVVLSKWLFRDCQVLIFEEPTRGVDVGAKVEIYQLMNQLAERGACILMISSELPEVMGMSDRVLVMRKGQIVKEVARLSDHRWPDDTKQEILRFAMGEVAI